LADYIYDLMVYDDNPFVRECASANYFKMPKQIKDAAERDISVLCNLAHLSSQNLKDVLSQNFPDYAHLFANLPNWRSEHIAYKPSEKWVDDMLKISEQYRQRGFSIFARYDAFTFTPEKDFMLTPVKSPDVVSLSSLRGYERERNLVLDNTKAFLSGTGFNNVLLYGDRGTGKSTTVRAMLSEFAHKKLRIIEVYKEHFSEFSRLVNFLEDLPFKFILFIDDLTFSENDDTMSKLKAVLEGTIVSKPKNVVIYATSNRRHLVRETFSARGGDEVHLSDTIDETLSLSDRFGLTITFISPNRENYLHIVEALALENGISKDELSMILTGAEGFAIEKGGRSPRVAKQYIESVKLSHIMKGERI
ncbi:MAG: ATP-binding protein, partial [Oscillospiraceae bacterium]|nr:ATP-binding protein [Oscillospiraceae bacterium]